MQLAKNTKKGPVLMDNLVDIHNHCNLSSDSAATPEDMAKAAFDLGVSHFALTDHIELDEFHDGEWDYWAAIEKTRPAFEKLKAEYDGKMHIYYGAEIGQPMYNLHTAEEILAAHDYDFVLGSVHRTCHYEHMGKIPDNEFDRKRVMIEYWEDMLNLVEWGKFCSLAHITFLLRFTNVDTPTGLVVEKTERAQAAYDTYKTIIDKILEIIVKKDIALEVNSSGYRRGLGGPMASAPFIKRYKELGGKLITVGSDAHQTSDVAKDIDKCYALLRELGFNEICVFKKKEPKFIKI